MAGKAALELTHVLYDAESYFSLAMALVTLSPILLMPAYASLVVFSREAVIIEMWAGQFVCEGVNLLLKRLVKQERPIEYVGNGYGFPSSHSQYMGYFATFLTCHLLFRHQFESFGHPLLDSIWRLVVHFGLVLWVFIVCYSRYHLTYHSIPQIAWGAGVGVLFGLLNYVLCEFIPYNYPDSLLGQLKRLILSSWFATSLRIRDGWVVWPDGGLNYGWEAWRSRWEAKFKGDQTFFKSQRGKKEL